MRTIKFRGKRLDNGEWVYGSPVIHDSGEAEIWDNSGEFIDWYMVDPETVGQFTGLKDKKGVDIYEGDILSNGINCKGQVRYISGMFVVDMVYDDTIGLIKDGDTGTFRLISVASVSEVIGNIHENDQPCTQ